MTCPNCGGGFEQRPGRGRPRRWCSVECSRVGRAGEQLLREAAERRARMETEVQVCGWCRGEFRGRRRRYCSRGCRAMDYQRWSSGRDRARELGLEAERFAAADVFDRDGWTCALCAGPVDAALRHPHPLSATLDHVVPLCRGGAHVVENVQATHLRCNLWKGNRTQEQVAAVLPIWSEVTPRVRWSA